MGSPVSKFGWGLVWILVLSVPLVGQQPSSDSRQPRTLDSHFPFLGSLYSDNAAWQARAAQLRFQVQVSLGLWPLPARTPLQAVVHGAVDQGDYIVEKVYFQSFPGFYVTGSLYRPKGESDRRRPGVLCPHGHYSNGRFTEFNSDAIAQMLARGEESLPENARSPLQTRCAHLARLGCVVFHYDMVGYADSQQITHEISHAFAKPRDGQNAADGWGFFSPRAELYLQSIMGLQTWNSIRALDFLESLPDVDPSRLAVTGSSGGGTQTFILAAIDPRPAVVFPAVMVSTGMQGGCTCENCSNLRVATGNVELAALFAPKPQGLSSADDWTKAMPEDGYPELQALYERLGHPQHVFLAPSPNFPHSYNQVARRVMYAWFARHLQLAVPQTESLEDVFAGKLQADSPFRESPIKFLSRDQLTVWDSQHPAPPQDPAIESQITRFWAAEQQRQVEELRRQNDVQLKQVARALLVDVASPAGTAPPKLTFSQRDPNTKVIRMDAGSFGDGWDAADLEVTFHLPASGESDATAPKQILIWVSAIPTPPQELGLFTAAGSEVHFVYCPDVRTPNRLVANGREGAAAYTFGYNRSTLARTGRLLRHYIDQIPRDDGVVVSLLAVDPAAPAAIAAAAAAEQSLARVILRDSIRFGDVGEFTHPHFFPGGLVLGDIPGLLRIAAPKEVICLGELREDLKRLGEQGTEPRLQVRAVADLAELADLP